MREAFAVLAMFALATVAGSSATLASFDSRSEIELSLTVRSFAPGSCGDPAKIARVIPIVVSTKPLEFESECAMEGTNHTIQSSGIQPHPSFQSPFAYEFGFPRLINLTAPELDFTDQSGVPKPRYCSDVLSTDNVTKLSDFCGGYLDESYPREFFATAGKDNFDKWYRDSINVNLRSAYSIKLARVSDNTFEYDSSVSSPEALQVNGSALGFFGPLDEVPASMNPYQLNARWPSTELEETELANTDMVLPHKYWFTTEIHTFFEYRGNETFVFRGDDDVFVYINGHKEIDGGGVHTAANFEINMDQLKQGPLVLGEVYSLDMFHAERRVVQSNFKIQTSLTASCTVQNTPENDTATVIVEDGFDVDGSDAWYLANANIDPDGSLVMIASDQQLHSWSHAWLKQEISVLRGFTVDFTYVLHGDSAQAQAHGDALVLAIQSSGIDDLQGGVAGNFGIRGLQGLFFVMDLCDNRGGGLDGPRPAEGVACVDQTVFKLRMNDQVVARQPVYARIADGQEHTVSIRYYARPNWVDVYHDGSLWLRATDLNLNETLSSGRAHVGFSASTSQLATRAEVTAFRASSVKVASEETRILGLPSEDASAKDVTYYADGADTLSIDVITFDFCGEQVDFGGLENRIDATLELVGGVDDDDDTSSDARRFLQGAGGGGGDGSDGVIDAEVVLDNRDGTYSVQFVTDQPGNYTLNIAFDGIPVCLEPVEDDPDDNEDVPLRCSPFVGAAVFAPAVPVDPVDPTFAPTSDIFVDRRPGTPSGLVYGVGIGAGVMMCWACLFMLLGRKDKRKWYAMSPFVERGRAAALNDGVEFAGEAQMNELNAELLRTREEINRLKARKGPRSSVSRELMELEAQSKELSEAIREIKLTQQMREDDGGGGGGGNGSNAEIPMTTAVVRPKLTWRERVMGSSSGDVSRTAGQRPSADGGGNSSPRLLVQQLQQLSSRVRASRSSASASGRGSRNKSRSGDENATMLVPAPPPDHDFVDPDSTSNIDV